MYLGTRLIISKKFEFFEDMFLYIISLLRIARKQRKQL